MTRTSQLRMPAALALALLGLAGTPVLAQTAPTPTQEDGVRDILNRAETQAQRRSVGDILGGLAGISQARAQTVPGQAPVTASAPAQTAASNQAGGDAAAQPVGQAQAPTAAPAAAPVAGPSAAPGGPAVAAGPQSTNLPPRRGLSVAQALPPSQPVAGPAPVAQGPAGAGLGSAANPRLIATMPTDSAPPAVAAPAAPVAVQTQGIATSTAAPVRIAAGPSGAIPVAGRIAVKPALVAVRHAPPRIMCIPGR